MLSQLRRLRTVSYTSCLCLPIMISRFGKSFMSLVFLMLLLTTIALIHPPARNYIDPWSGQFFGEGGVEKTWHSEDKAHHKGGVIMSKLGNETAKAALGRATWKLLHTMTLRFPEHPTLDEREALSSYFYLSSRLYPCGECAVEFQELLKKYPPQTTSRRAASLWLCFIHNEVNKRLKKAEFDCAHLSDEYDCGCRDQITTTATPSIPNTKNSDLTDLGDDWSRDSLTGADMIRGG